MTKINGRTVELILAKDLKEGDVIYQSVGVIETLLKVINIEKSKVKNPFLNSKSIDVVVEEKGEDNERYFGFHPKDKLHKLITIRNTLENL